ncbi:Fe(3+) ABC transporter substrate-binding protein [Aureimonas pseudogalii]|uniref:Iron(III) transport system substrate-binding protein n=1 Tax=Aureimonas pseudogalii TaxID=1744844 RepID=A0A7W6E9Y2_9HYPH|nr:Fe(3+) ABC transporter substrate-binding protein [Aureimonas pseudogalii]MBB3996999.1 iron(III) transport system substrate-binding protein [Aureimonas pseudogalii]
MHPTFLRHAAALALAATGAAIGAPALAADVNIYSSRQPALIQPLLDAFTKETGLSTATIFIEKGLEERVKAEGANSPADVILTVDIGRLYAAKQAGILQPLADAVIERDIPATFRDKAGEWSGVTARARVVYASAERVGDEPITYESLADPRWKGRICIRSGQHQYNVALIAAFLAHHGEEKTKTWLTGLRDNLATAPEGGDRDQARNIASGQCDIAIGNTYYVGLMQTNEKEPQQKEWAKAIKVVMPAFETGGTHVNISGMGLAKNAPNRDNAVKLMEFLTTDEAQRIYAETNYEYPLKPGVALSPAVKAFGELKPDTLSLDDIAAQRSKASALIDEVRFDEGPQS